MEGDERERERDWENGGRCVREREREEWKALHDFRRTILRGIKMSNLVISYSNHASNDTSFEF